MPLVSRLGAASSRGFGEFNQQAAGKYIEDYFSTYLYTGTGSSQTITNNIPLITTASWNTYYYNTTGVVDVTADSSGNIYTAGSVVGKQNSGGTFQWGRIPNLSGQTLTSNGIVTGSTGDIYVAGYVFDGSVGQCACVVKYDSSGNLIWSKYLPNSSVIGSYFYDIAIDSSDNIYACGYYVDSGGTYYGYIVKFNSSGTVQFQRTIRNGGSNYLYGICIDSSGNIFACGALGANFITAKWDSSGTFQWARQLADTTVNASEANKVTSDSSGNVYVVGYATRSGVQYVLIAKYDTSGTLQWQRKSTNSTGSLTYARGVAIDSVGNLYVSANTFDSSAVNSYVAVYKYNTSGTLQSKYVFNYTGSDSYGYGAFIDVNSNLYISTTSNSSRSYTIKFKSTASNISGVAYYYTGIPDYDTEEAGTATASSVSPNTSNPSFSYSTGLTSSNATNTTAIYSQTEASGSGMVWTKDRTTAGINHGIFDTTRGIYKYLSSNTTSGQTTSTGSLTNFLSNGFIVGGLNITNNNTDAMVSWTFRKQPKFFDVLTYTGDGSTDRTINHSLDSTPAMIFVKCTSEARNWIVYNRNLDGGSASAYQYILSLNSTSGEVFSPMWKRLPTSTEFYVTSEPEVNGNGKSYVAYLFAHNAGGFGADGSQNVISCGSYSGTGASGNNITLGYEPQFLLVKQASASGNNWVLVDVMRGMSQTAQSFLYPNSSSAEVATSNWVVPTATGFSLLGTGSLMNASGSTYIYMAIRRGPMRTPTDATKVYSVETNQPASGGLFTNNVLTDFAMLKSKSVSQEWYFFDRLRGNSKCLNPPNTTAEGTEQFLFDQMTGGTGTGFGAGYYVSNVFRRAPGFFDVVCFSGAYSSTNYAHNLGVAPEMIVIKKRTGTSSWPVYHIGVPSPLTNQPNLNNNAGYYANNYFSSTPTASVFSTQYLDSGTSNYVAYLFATCPGVSKVGSYTGTGATQTISCGFTGGARYVLIKRTDDVGDWWVWDTARGMVAGTDPRLAYSSTAAEINANWVYTTTGGFQIVTSDATVNASGGSYIFLAIA